MATKACIKCGIEYLATPKFFPKDKRLKLGLRGRCWICTNIARKDSSKRWNEANRDKRAHYAHATYCRNKKNCYKRVLKYKKTLKGYLVHRVAALRTRCYNPNCERFNSYGGRGINVCFDADELLAWCREREIDPHGLEIHRLNGDGDYTLSNITFITKSEHTVLHNLKGH